MHVPVLTEKLIEYLNPKANENFIDCTIGGGGHAKAILEKTAPKGKVLGIDWDTEALQNLKLEIQNSKFKKRLILVNDNFANLADIVKREKFRPVHGIVLDLGISSDHFEKSQRGFSFRKNETLDMRINRNHGLDAKKILNFWSRQDIEKILKDYGEEQFARDIAKAIVRERSRAPIMRTFQLVRIIQNATPRWYGRRKIHPATKTFQALRIAVNGELENLERVLQPAEAVLPRGGRLAVISFHSLEDRIVKKFLRQEHSLRILTKKPVTPTFQEIRQNPRARSAKLRAAEKISPTL